SIKSVFEVSKENLDQLLTFTPIYSSDINFDSIYTFLKDELKFTPISKLKDYLPNVIDKLDVYFDLGEEQTTGIFMHLAAMIERKLSGEQSSTNQDLSLLDTFSEDVKILQQLLKPLEKNFNILIDDNELVTILMILKKI
ncbi:PRD domain-containing protein, partial [Streptococcus hyointestinalis]